MAIKKATTETFVYVIEASGLNVFKIGIADNPRIRLSELQVGSPTDLILLGFWRGSGLAEKRIHRSLRSFHKRGEWFNAPLGLVIESISVYCDVSYRQAFDDVNSGILRAVVPSRDIGLGAYGESLNVSRIKLPDIPRIKWEDVGNSVMAWYIPKDDMPKSRWIHLGYLEDCDMESRKALRDWLDGRYLALDLNNYNPDAVYDEWLRIQGE